MDDCTNNNLVPLKSLKISNGNDVQDLARDIFYGRRLENMESLLPTLMHVIDELVKLGKFEVRVRGSATEFDKIKPKVNFIRDLDFVCERKGCIFKFTDGVGNSNSPKEAHTIAIHSRCIEFCIFNGQIGVFTKIKCNLQEYLEKAYYDFQDKEESSKLNRNNNTFGVSIECNRLALRIGVVNKRYFDLFATENERDNESLEHMICVDFVEGIRCQNFPKLFTEWIVRERKYGWPSVETIEEIKNTGCELIAELNQRENRWGNNKTLWIVSFSNAERILVNSWTDKQQTVYHMLKYFIDRQYEKNGTRFVNTYNMKLVMFWKCEETPEEWWSENEVIDICDVLLKDLFFRISKWRLADYFLPIVNKLAVVEENITDGTDGWIPESVDSGLKVHHSFARLKEWFNENYLTSVSSKFNADEGVLHGESNGSTDTKLGY